VRSVVDEHAMAEAVKRLSMKARVDRLEATVEAHVMAAAHVREQLKIYGTTSRTAWLCRDKPAMKDAVRKAGLPCAASARVTSVADAEAFAKQTGYPLILKPLDGAGASGTSKVTNDAELRQACTTLRVEQGAHRRDRGVPRGPRRLLRHAVGGGKPVLDFACHYYPNVLEAMRTRWISPQIVCTNRIDSDSYQELRALGAKVIEALGIWTSPTHMEWFAGRRA
jgi:D-alanine-D-alanine ligase-like ATP-grasp enzyme